MSRISFLILTFFLSGCATLNSQESFEEVSNTVKERTGQQIVWKKEVSGDDEVKKQIAEFLRSSLTVDDALKISLINNPTLQAEYEELGIAQAELVQAGLLQNPVLTFERRFRGKAAEGDISQNFLSLFLISLRTKAASAELDAATKRITQLVLNHTAEVKSAFYSLQAEQQIFEMRQTVVKALTASYEAAKALREAGNISLLEVQNEANMLAQAKVELAQASVRVLEEREHLNVLLGAWGNNTGWKIENRLPNLPGEEVTLSGLESFAISHRLDLAAAKNELESVAARVGIARYEAIIPDLTVTGHYEREPEGAITRGPSIVFPLPLFNWGEAASAQGNALFKQSLRRYEAMAIDLRSKVRVAYGRMKAARMRAEYFYKEVLPLQKKTLEQTELFYNGMFVGVFQLLQAKQAQITAGQSYIETLKEYWLRRTELEQAVGGSFKGLPASNETSISVETPHGEIDPSPNTHQHHHGS